jgi:hypothetical protein
MTVVNVPGDGNCFYHSLAHQLHGTELEMDHVQLRERVAIGAEPVLMNLYYEGGIDGDVQRLIDELRMLNCYVSNRVPSLVSNILGILHHILTSTCREDSRAVDPHNRIHSCRLQLLSVHVKIQCELLASLAAGKGSSAVLLNAIRKARESNASLVPVAVQLRLT